MSFERLIGTIDLIAIPYGIGVLILSFTNIDYSCLRWFIWAAAVLAVVYLFYAIHLFRRRPLFDWHLINGHFFRKVCCLILLMPFLLTTVSGFFIESPKEMIYEENLYEQSDSKLHCDLTQKQKSPNLFWSNYYHFVSPGSQHMTTTSAGRNWAAVISLLGIFLLNGLLISSIIGWIERRKEKWSNGSIRYKCLGQNRFAVVIGASEISASVIRNLFTPQKEGELNYKCEGDNRYVILQTSRNVEEVRDELASHLSECELKRVIIYKALRDSAEELDKLHIENATEIYVLGESTSAGSGEPFHDAINMRCVNLIGRKLDTINAPMRKKAEEELRQKGENADCQEIKWPKRKVCKVMFEYQTTSSILQFSDISETIKNNLVFIPFSRYESWARAVIANNSAMEDSNADNGGRLIYTPMDGPDGISEDDDSHVHLVVVGMSKMGVAMGIQAMLQAHYLNFAKAETEKDDRKRAALMSSRRTRITFIDTNADKEMGFFKGRYENLFNLAIHRYIDANQCDAVNLDADSSFGWTDPMKSTGGKWAHLSKGGENFIDLEIEFIKGEVESDGVRSYLRNISDNSNAWVKNSKLTIAICLKQTHQAVAASLYMPVDVYEKAQEVWVYQRESADIVLNLTKTGQKDKRYKKLRPFGMLFGEYINDRSQYLKALLVNGAYNLDGEIDGKKILAEDRDMTKRKYYKDLRAKWKELSMDKQFSNRYFADAIPLKIRSVQGAGLSSAELADAIERHSETLGRSEHNRWNVQQLLSGYSPCDKDIDDEIAVYNENYKAAHEVVKKWHNEIGWDNLPEAEQERLKETDARHIAENKEKDAFKARKAFYKEDERRMHPNICEFNHLDKVDSEAKGYDTKLNSIIPVIRALIDDRIAMKN